MNWELKQLAALIFGGSGGHKGDRVIYSVEKALQIAKAVDEALHTPVETKKAKSKAVKAVEPVVEEESEENEVE